MDDIMQIVQALKDSNILLKRVTKTIKTKTKEQTWGFLNILFGTLGASLLGNMLSGKGILKAGYGNKEEKGIVKIDSTPSLNKLWNTKNTIKMNLDSL